MLDKFTAALRVLRNEMTKQTGRRDAILEVRVHGDLGLALDIVPGASKWIDGVIVHADRHVTVNGETMTAAELQRRATAALDS